ncbi:MAG: PAS domain-containing protein [Caldilineaceae bacterium]|nr:PAS domain-containing protein [Caldilineaceae bacterium]
MRFPALLMRFIRSCLQEKGTVMTNSRSRHHNASGKSSAGKALPPAVALPEQTSSTQERNPPFLIVAVGASAGGLKAFETFFKSLPDEPNMAFVVIQHLAPHHESELAEILQNHTAMTVAQVQGQEQVHPNAVYIIPPGQSLGINDGILYLSEPKEPHGQRAPIDLFFRSLAQDQGENAVCVILSGTGSDGTLGLKSIKEQNGVVLVQAPETAEYAGMPRSAVNTGLVDLVAPVDELAQKLLEYQQSAGQFRFTEQDEELPKAEADLLQRIFTQLDSRVGVDFSQYKRSTVLRRLQRRMQVNQVTSFEAYLTLLRTDYEEIDALFKDLLISVTNFFRDEEIWQVLAHKIIPPLFDRLAHPNDSIRVWVPGCATGEEAYSIAILLLEEADRRNVQPQLQVFATDLNEDALAFARSGLYPDAIAADVASERLQRFFERSSGGYQVRPRLQEIVLFAPHNLVKDVPFAHLNLVSCRNLLIYLERKIQQGIFQIFHFALEEDGYLLLGGSESAEQAQDFFETVDKRQRIYQVRPGKATLPQLPISMATEARRISRPSPRSEDAAAKEKFSLGGLHQQLMLRRYAPPSVIVDRNYDIRYKFGDVGRYLRHQEGEPSLNLLDNISKQIRVELRTGLFTALRKREAITPRPVRLEIDGHTERVLLHIEPVPEQLYPVETLVLVIFEPLSAPNETEQSAGQEAGADPTVVQQLETELQELRHRMQTTVEEYETSNEELRSSNEELQSMNEELRSTTEELETSREELRSTGEELQSMNQELKYKIDDLNRANSDLENLIKATNIATLFLNRELCLQRYTPVTTALFNIIPSDVGRPFSHISHKINHRSLPDLAERVLRTLETVEEEVGAQDDRWFLLQIRPYRTIQDRIEGVVITLVDVTAQHHAEQLAKTHAMQQAVVAELGMMALRGMVLDELMEMAVRRVAATLDVDYAKVLQLLPAENQLRLIAGVGWHEGIVGTAVVDSGTDSQAGFTLHSDKPVIVEDLPTEKRFRGPALLTDHAVISGISVVIQRLNGPYGVLGAHSRQERQFTQQDADFLQGIANILGTAIERQRAETERQELLARVQAESAQLETVLQQMPAAVIIADAPSGQLMMGNDLVEEIWRRPYLDVHSVEEYVQYPGFYPDGTRLAPEEWPLARAIRNGEVVTDEEVIIARGDGTQGVISNSAAPIVDDEGEIVAGVVIFQDVTERKRIETERDRLVQELRELTGTLERRVEERTQALRTRSEQLSAMASALTVAEQRERERISQILHDDLQQLIYATQMRVLLLEGELADTAETQSVREGLSEVGQLHDRAISIVRSLTVELSPPILSDQLSESLEWLAGHMEGNYGLSINFTSEDGAEPANSDMRELAFQVVRELLFNIVKHAGVEKARLTLRQQDGRCLITVADDGNGFDVNAIEPQSTKRTGYGLHSVRERLSLFNGTLAVESAPAAGTRITVSLPGIVQRENRHG